MAWREPATSVVALGAVRDDGWPGYVTVMKVAVPGKREFLRYVPERTCHMTKKDRNKVLADWWECSECGPVYPPCNDEVARWALQYCPRCGARVVEEER